MIMNEKNWGKFCCYWFNIVYCFQSRGGLGPRIGSIREHSGEEDAIAEGNEASARVEEVEEGARVEAHFTEDNSGTLCKGKKKKYTLLFLRFDI